MRVVKIILLLCLLATTAVAMAVQKQVYDIISYEAPANWTPEKGEGFLSYSKIDGDSWCQIAIYQHRTSKGDIESDFDSEWKALVANSKTVTDEEKTKPESTNEWSVMSGSGIWKYNGANVASILTVYSNKKVCVSILCNTTAQPYIKDYQSLIASLSLDASKVNDAASSTSTNRSVVGLWVDYINESNGTVNGISQLTAGYFRREYLFKADGTYVFRAKDWTIYQKDILFLYEVGTWKVEGNKITLTPKQGKGGWWAKAASGRTTEWGNLKKVSEYKPETVTYSFDFSYYSVTKKTYLVFRNKDRTQRDRSISGKDNVYEWSYSPRSLDNSLIDNPPGFKPPSSTTSSSAKRSGGGTTAETLTRGGTNIEPGEFLTQSRCR